MRSSFRGQKAGGREVKEHAILYTTTQAIDLGRAVLAARDAHTDPVAAIIESASGVRLFDGKVFDVDRRATDGFLRGRAEIDGLGGDSGSRFTVHFQNEFSVGYRDGAPVVMTPDLICVVDSVSGDGIGTDVIRYGQRVSVLALPSPAADPALAHAAPCAAAPDRPPRLCRVSAPAHAWYARGKPNGLAAEIAKFRRFRLPRPWRPSGCPER